MTNNHDIFTEFHKSSNHSPVSFGDRNIGDVVGMGTVKCVSVVNGHKHKIELKEVLYVPSLMSNLISVSRMRKAGLKVEFDSDQDNKGICQVIKKRMISPLLRGYEDETGLFERTLRP